MAHKKGQGSTRNGRDSNPQYLGVKRYGGERVSGGTILVRQRGTLTTIADGQYAVRSSTPALVEGVVAFQKKGRHGTFVHVSPAVEAGEATAAAE